MQTKSFDERTISLFMNLVTISATSSREKPVADFIRSYLDGCPVKIIEDSSDIGNNGNSGNLICTVGNGGNTLLSCHMDTPLDTKDTKPVRHVDRITSDGSTILGVDNRLGVTTLLRLLEIASQNPDNFQDFTVVFTICEESTLGGSKALVHPENITQAYVFDSSFRPGHFVRGSHGSMTWKLKIHGRSAHAGLAPERGINAIHIACNIIHQLPNGRIDNTTTFNVAQISGGSATNVVPDLVSVSGEIRSWKQEDVENQVSFLRQIAERACSKMGGIFKLEAEWVFEPFLIPENAPIIKRLESHYHKLGLKPESHIVAGGSDANSYNKNGLPALNLGIGAQNPHGQDEFVLLEDMVTDLELAKALVARNPNENT